MAEGDIVAGDGLGRRGGHRLVRSGPGGSFLASLRLLYTLPERDRTC
jgi:hypothetical protein